MKNTRRIICTLLAFALMLCGCSSLENSNSPTVEGDGFETPEAAVLAYLAAMKKGDVDEMISTFAIETLVDNYDLITHIEISGGYSANMTYPICSDNEYTRSILLLRRQTALNNALLKQYFYFNAEEESLYSNPTTFGKNHPYQTPSELFDALMNPNWMRTLAGMSYNEPLTDTELKRLLPTEYWEDVHLVEKYNLQRKSYFCYEDISTVAVEVYLDGELYHFFMEAVCYGGKWFNFQHGGFLATTYMNQPTLSEGFVPVDG